MCVCVCTRECVLRACLCLCVRVRVRVPLVLSSQKRSRFCSTVYLQHSKASPGIKNDFALSYPERNKKKHKTPPTTYAMLYSVEADLHRPSPEDPQSPKGNGLSQNLHLLINTGFIHSHHASGVKIMSGFGGDWRSGRTETMANGLI